jgi:hypothetical protein
MKKVFIFFALLTFYSGVAKSQTWAIDADYAESCECNAPCPCIVGLKPTHRKCVGNSVISINKGHYGDVKVDGLKLFITFSLGEWTKAYIDEKATQAQGEAIMKLLKQRGTIAFFFKNDSVSTTKAKISIKQSDTTFTFSVPGSFAQIKYLKGKDGKPISLQNLKHNYLTNNKLCQSVDLHHTGDKRAFQYSSTAGIVSHFISSSEK